jgi:hypothetical protein
MLVSSLGCAWVELDPAAEPIRVVPSTATLEGCTQVGTINAQTRAKIGFIKRRSDKVADELSSLARNNAVDMGANAVVPVAPPSDEGRQRFTAYRCP